MILLELRNSKEINGNIDKEKNLFSNLKRRREELFRRKMEWINSLSTNLDFQKKLQQSRKNNETETDS